MLDGTECKVGEALSDLSDLDQHVKCICKIVEQLKSVRKKTKERKWYVCVPESQCGKICVEAKFLKKKIDKKPNSMLKSLSNSSQKAYEG